MPVLPPLFRSKLGFKITHIRIRDASQTSDIRLFIDQHEVKYLRIYGQSYPGNVLNSLKALATQLPAFPEYEWNFCYVERGPRTGLPAFFME
jgi:hypothetical protein